MLAVLKSSEKRKEKWLRSGSSAPFNIMKTSTGSIRVHCNDINSRERITRRYRRSVHSGVLDFTADDLVHVHAPSELARNQRVPHDHRPQGHSYRKAHFLDGRVNVLPVKFHLRLLYSHSQLYILSNQSQLSKLNHPILGYYGLGSSIFQAVHRHRHSG